MSVQMTFRNLLALPVFLALAGLRAQAPVRPLVEVNTTQGRVVWALYNETPLHRDNFLRLVREHYYDSTLFHRVVPGAMLIGGDATSKAADDRHKVLGQGSVGTALPPEIRPGIVHVKGAVGMLPDETAPAADKRSHGAFFYIVQGQDWAPGDLRLVEQKRATLNPEEGFHYTPEQLRAYATDGGSPKMDGNYTIFAQVIEGLDVIDRIAALPCDGRDRPLTDVRLWMRELK